MNEVVLGVIIAVGCLIGAFLIFFIPLYTLGLARMKKYGYTTLFVRLIPKKYKDRCKEEGEERYSAWRAVHRRSSSNRYNGCYYGG